MINEWHKTVGWLFISVTTNLTGMMSVMLHQCKLERQAFTTNTLLALSLLLSSSLLSLLWFSCFISWDKTQHTQSQANKRYRRGRLVHRKTRGGLSKTAQGIGIITDILLFAFDSVTFIITCVVFITSSDNRIQNNCIRSEKIPSKITTNRSMWQILALFTSSSWSPLFSSLLLL